MSHRTTSKSFQPTYTPKRCPQEGNDTNGDAIIRSESRPRSRVSPGATRAMVMQTAMTMPREGTDVKENAVIVRQGRSRRDFHRQSHHQTAANWSDKTSIDDAFGKVHHQTAANWSDKTSIDDAFGKVTTPSDAAIVRQDRGRSAICTGCPSPQSCRRPDLLRRRSV